MSLITIRGITLDLKQTSKLLDDCFDVKETIVKTLDLRGADGVGEEEEDIKFLDYLDTNPNTENLIEALCTRLWCLKDLQFLLDKFNNISPIYLRTYYYGEGMEWKTFILGSTVTDHIRLSTICNTVFPADFFSHNTTTRYDKSIRKNLSTLGFKNVKLKSILFYTGHIDL